MGDTHGSTKVAAFDIGSNSIKMTVATVAQDGSVAEGISAMKTVRLGQGIDRSGLLNEDRMTAAMDTLIEMTGRARLAGATKLIGVATEAVRVARNGQAFLDDVSKATGISIALISGNEEAELSYAGLASLLSLDGAIVMADIGGASTEVVAGDGETVLWATSLPLGSGRLTDEHLTSDPPTTEELEACKSAARKQLAPLDLESQRSSQLIISGGTGQYLGALLDNHDDISRSDVEAALAKMTTLTSDELASLIDIAPLRARVLPAGIAIVAAIADRVEPVRIVAGPSGLRAGLLLAAAKGKFS